VRYKKYLFVLIILFHVFKSNGQSESFDYALNHREYLNEKDYWVPSLLASTPNALYYLSTYGGNLFNWNPRGLKNKPEIILNGIFWNLSLPNTSSITTNLYLNKQFKQGEVTEHFDFNYNGANLFYGGVYYNSSPIDLKPSIQFNTGYRHPTGVVDFEILYNSGKLKYNWHYSVQASVQGMAVPIAANSYKKFNGVSFLIEKKLKNDQKIIGLIWWDKLDQNRKSPFVKEVFELTNDKYYSPNWGWYKGRQLFSSKRENNLPVGQLTYTKNWKDTKHLTFNIGIAKGFQSRTGLDWSHASDPRPDYYKYLPSHAASPELKKQLKEWLQLNPNLLQIDFDKIELSNKRALDGHSSYILNNSKIDITAIKSSILLQYEVNEKINFIFNGNYSFEKGHYTNSIDDLLGGHFYNNYNSWVDESGGEDLFQYDVISPDKKIKLNDIWGPNFAIRSTVASVNTQLKFLHKKFEYTIGYTIGKAHISREGFNKNGQFVNSSYGLSNALQFPFQSLASSITYKFNGRLYAKSILFTSIEPPTPNLVYLNIDLTAIQSAFTLPVVASGVDFSLIYRGVPEKIQWNLFFQKTVGQSGHHLFYHDGYNSFVYGQYGQLNTIKLGTELILETTLFSFFQINATSTWGKYSISNNPIYQLSLGTDLYKVESGLLHLEGLTSSNSPELVHAISISCQPLNQLQATITGIYAADRHEEIDYFKRSFLVEAALQKQHLQPLESQLLPNAFLVNFFLSKSLVYKINQKRVQSRITLSARNILNSFIPVIAYEQSRYDYKNFDKNKFPSKYLFDTGLIFSASIKFQIL
jgi:hypothetical protein